MIGPTLRHLGAGDRWILVDPYTYDLADCAITLPSGFTSDLASVPDVLHWLIDDDQLGTAGPLLHDALYQSKGAMAIEWCEPYRTFTRREADELLVRYARLEGCPKWRCTLAMWAVRVFARPAWG